MRKELMNHTVSLTKNGYFKLIELINKYDANGIKENLSEISLDETQALKMLGGIDASSSVPEIWTEIHNNCDKHQQFSLLIISIIFSHKDLIDWLKSSTHSEMRGKIRRDIMGEKVYTNLAYAFNQAGLAPTFRPRLNETEYDLTSIFISQDIAVYAKKLIELQLERMGFKEDINKLFQRSFFEQCEVLEFHKVLGLALPQFIDWLSGNTVKTSYMPTSETSFSIQKFIHDLDEAKIKMPKQLPFRFLSAILTKQFTILTGLSGSGKTKLAEAFSSWISIDEKKQVCIVAVGSDWTNRDPLLGFPNALEKGRYVKSDNGVLDLIINATSNPNLPFFLILDEMNMSHVERYFADFLSAMESINGLISLHADTPEWKNEYDTWKDGIPAEIALPKNLFIIGTVNIDETTYMFSPKVLDRAQVIEFRVDEIEMKEYLENPEVIKMIEIRGKGASMALDFVAKAKNKDLILENQSTTLMPFFEKLQEVGAEFGYRTASEITRFIAVCKVLLNGDKELQTIMNDENIIDFAIMQKLLPKVHGSRNKIESILRTLAQQCLFDISKDPFKGSDSGAIKYHLSYGKIERMHRRVLADGFTSYAEA